MAPDAITARTSPCGIVLHPAGHTHSPAVRNAAYPELGVDAVYLAFDVPPQARGAAVREREARLIEVLARVFDGEVCAGRATHVT
jgi:shikimate 5-dehydrogenase